MHRSPAAGPRHGEPPVAAACNARLGGRLRSAGRLAGLALAIASACVPPGQPLVAVADVRAPSPPVQEPEPGASEESGPGLSAPAQEAAPGPTAQGESRSAAAAPERPNAALVSRDVTRVVVLMYHTIDSQQTSRSVSPERLDAHLAWMRDNGVYVASLDELVAFLEGARELPASVAVITIDDGEANAYRFAYPVLRRHGARFALGIPTGVVEPPKAGCLSWEEIREMIDSGLCTVASHSHTHTMLMPKKDDDIRFELEHSRALLERHAGVRPEVFFYPMGGTNRRVRALVREAGYRAAFVAWGRPVDASVPLWHVPRYQVDATTTVGAVAGFFRRARRPLDRSWQARVR